jgi:hypothetical protein
MVRRRKLRVTNPAFLQYANMEREFAVSDPAHHDVAWLLVVNYFPGIDWRCGYTPEKVRQALKAHQPTFRAVLDGLIAQDLTPAQEATIRLHVGHFSPHPRWDRSPPQSYIDPARAGDIEVYGEVFEPQDPLDPLYYQLHLYLRSRHVQDLRRCPTCGHYFWALTVRTTVYCCDTCRGQQTPAEAKRRAVQKWRAGETEKDLEEVRAAVRQVRDRGARELVFEEVWAQFREPPGREEADKRPIGPRTFKQLLREVLGDEFVG